MSNKKKILELEKEDQLLKRLDRAESKAAHWKNEATLEKQRRVALEQDVKLSQAVDANLDITDTFTPTVYRIPKLRKGGKATAIIGATDWHVEEQVDPSTVNGMNAYNLAIADKRIKQLWHKARYLLEASRTISDIKDAVLWLGGDFISGQIHDELAEVGACGPAEAMLWAQERLAGGIAFLLESCGLERITVVANCGNHGRTTKQMRHATAYAHSWEWFAYKNIEREFRNDNRVTFVIPRGYQAIIDIQGHNIRFHHGHWIKFAGGVGGISIPSNKKHDNWNKAQDCEFSFFGHFHHFIRMWKYAASGCLIGQTPYSADGAFDPQPPTQLFSVVDRERGVVDVRPIYVDEVKK